MRQGVDDRGRPQDASSDDDRVLRRAMGLETIEAYLGLGYTTLKTNGMTGVMSATSS